MKFTIAQSNSAPNKVLHRTAILRVNAPRSGTVRETTAFLNQLETTFNQSHSFIRLVELFDPESESFRRRFRLWYDIGLPPYINLPLRLPTDSILLEERLVIHRVQLVSPGFWEFLGALNPLHQIREYLDDRHRRRHDKEYREQAEQDKLSLQNVFDSATGLGEREFNPARSYFDHERSRGLRGGDSPPRLDQSEQASIRTRISSKQSLD